MKKRIGIIVALEEEHFHLKKCVGLLGIKGFPYTICLVKSGVGMINAMHTAQDMISQDRLELILNVGVVAGRGDLRVGEIISVDKVYNGDFNLSIFGHDKYYMPEVGNYIEVPKHGMKTSLRSLPCFSVSKFEGGNLDTNEENYVVDMEYYGIAYACKQSNIPTCSIKIVSDTVLQDNHIEYVNNLDRCSEILAGYIAGILAGTLV